MFYRRLGKSNIEVSALGLGCYAIGGPFRVENGKPWGWSQVDDRESIRAIHAGLDLGINFIDTAQAYGCGHSEAVIGKAIKGRRDKVILATKFGKVIDEKDKRILGSTIDADDLRQALEGSLRRFDSDYIDLYQWHESRGKTEDVPELLDLLDSFVQAGKIRWYGWSTDDPERARLFAQSPNCAAIQHRLHVFENPENAAAVLAVCQEFDTASINRSPLMMGILTGKFKTDTTFPEDDVRHSLGFDFEKGLLAEYRDKAENIRAVLTSEGRSMVQGALAWIWARHERTIPIPGFKSVKQVQENARTMEFRPLNPTQMRQIDEILER